MSELCNQIVGTVVGYPSFLSNPAAPLARYLLQKMLGRFLINGITLSPSDLSMADISLNDLKFDCQVLNQLMGSSNPLTVVQCNVKNLTVKNWMSPASGSSAKGGVKVVASDVDILMMPIAAKKAKMEQDKQMKAANDGLQKPKRSADSLKPVDIQQNDVRLAQIQAEQAANDGSETSSRGYIVGLLNDMMTRLLRSLEIEVRNINVRIMTREQKQLDDVIPTLLLHIPRIALEKKEARMDEEKSAQEDIESLLDGKGASISELSVHLLPSPSYTAAVQPQTSEHQQEADLIESGSAKTPLTIPSSQPSTILLWRAPDTESQSREPACEINFNFAEQSLAATIRVAELEVILGVEQLKELQKFQTYIAEIQSNGNDDPSIADKQQDQGYDDLQLAGPTGFPFRDRDAMFGEMTEFIEFEENDEEGRPRRRRAGEYEPEPHDPSDGPTEQRTSKTRNISIDLRTKAISVSILMSQIENREFNRSSRHGGENLDISNVYDHYHDKAFKVLQWSSHVVEGTVISAPLAYALSLEDGLSLQFYLGDDTKSQEHAGNRPYQIKVSSNPFGAELMEKRQQKLADSYRESHSTNRIQQQLDDQRKDQPSRAHLRNIRLKFEGPLLLDCYDYRTQDLRVIQGARAEGEEAKASQDTSLQLPQQEDEFESCLMFHSAMEIEEADELHEPERQAGIANKLLVVTAGGDKNSRKTVMCVDKVTVACASTSPSPDRSSEQLQSVQVESDGIKLFLDSQALILVTYLSKILSQSYPKQPVAQTAREEIGTAPVLLRCALKQMQVTLHVPQDSQMFGQLIDQMLFTSNEGNPVDVLEHEVFNSRLIGGGSSIDKQAQQSVTLLLNDIEVKTPMKRIKKLQTQELTVDWLPYDRDAFSQSLTASQHPTLRLKCKAVQLGVEMGGKSPHILLTLNAIGFEKKDEEVDFEGREPRDDGQEAGEEPVGQSSSDEDNFIIYEDDEDGEGSLGEQKQVEVDDQSKSGAQRTSWRQCVVQHISVDVDSLRVFFPMMSDETRIQKCQTNSLDILDILGKLDVFIKSYQAFSELARVLPVDEEVERRQERLDPPQRQTITEVSANLKKMDVFVTKEDRKGRRALLQVRLENFDLSLRHGDQAISPEDQVEKNELSIKLGNMLAIDFCQQRYKLYNEVRVSSTLFSVDEAGLSPPELADLEASSALELLQQYEHSVLLYKHCSFLEQAGKTKRDLLEAKLAVSFDVSQKHVFTNRTLKGIKRQTGFQLDVLESERLRQLPVQIYDLFMELQVNPMTLKGQLILKDLSIRVQPLLSQGMDDLESPRKEKFDELNASIYSFQESELMKSRARSFLATSLLNEFIKLQLELGRSQQSLKEQCEKLDATIIRKRLHKDQINVEVKAQNFAVDVHPVVRFEQYLEIFGQELEREKRARGFHYPRFDRDLKFRLSQRIVLSVKEVCCRVSLCEQSAHKQIGTTVQSLSLQVLDQSRHATCEHLNPQALCPGMPVTGSSAESLRHPLFLLDGTSGLSSSTYLESLGFKQILLVDHFDVQVSFETIKNIRKGTSLPDNPQAMQEQALDQDMGPLHREEEEMDGSILYETAYAPETASPLNGRADERTKFEKFMIQTNIKKILVYLTKDSLRTVKQALDGLQANLEQLEARGNGSEPADSLDCSLRSDGADVNESNNLSSILDSVLKEHGYLDRFDQGATVPGVGRDGTHQDQALDLEPQTGDHTESFLREFQEYEDTSLSHQINKEDNKDLLQADALSKNIFQVNQIDLHQLEHFGCKQLDLSSFMRNDYVPAPRSETRASERFRRQHRQPRIEVGKVVSAVLKLHTLPERQREDSEPIESIVASEPIPDLELEPKIDSTGQPTKEQAASSNKKDDLSDPYAYLQPKVAVYLHLQTIDVKLFQGADFDFRDEYADPRSAGCVLAADIGRQQGAIDNQRDPQQDHAAFKSTPQKKLSRIVDANYFQRAPNVAEQPVSKAQDGIMNPYLLNRSDSRPASSIGASEISSNVPQRSSIQHFKRKRGQKRGCYYQIMLKNIFCSQYRMKNALFKKREEIRQHHHLRDICHKVLYKYDRRALSIQEVFIKENISTSQRGRVLVDTFHLPYAYKYHNFCDFLCYEENYVKKKYMGIRAELQPFKLKLRQDVINFAMDFLQQASSGQESDLPPDQQKLQGVAQVNESFSLDHSLEQRRASIRSRRSTYAGSFHVEARRQMEAKQAKKKRTRVPVYVKELCVRETHMSLSYSSQTFSINELLNHGNTMEYLNIFNINDLTLRIRPYNLPSRRLVELPEALNHVSDFYTTDFGQNQRLAMVAALGPVRSISRVGGALWGVLWRPIEGGMSSQSAGGRPEDRGRGTLMPEFDAGGMLRGVVEGVSELAAVLGEEGQNARKKVWRVAGGVAEGVAAGIGSTASKPL